MTTALLLAVAVLGADTTRLSLDEAVSLALRANPTVAAARARGDAAEARVWNATRAFLPSTRLELQSLQTTDPVGAFGMKLRQERFAAEDLTLDALNRPDALGGYTASIGVELPLLAPEGWYGFAAAQSAAEAERAGARRTAGAIAFEISRLYWDVRLAERSAEALDAAFEAARAHAREAEALERQGLVTGLDARLARIAWSEVEIRREQALVQHELALGALAAQLGVRSDGGIVLTDDLDIDLQSRCAAEAECRLGERADLEALRAGADAARQVQRSAWWAQLPQVLGFAGLAHHSADAPWGAGSGDWTVGVGVRWNVFPGLAGVGGVREAAARRRAVDAELDRATRAAETEVHAASRRMALAERSVDLAERAAAEARVALDQARLRYRTGVAPVTELLDVQAKVTDTTLAHWTARRDLLVARAALDFAYGVHDR